MPSIGIDYRCLVGRLHGTKSFLYEGQQVFAPDFVLTGPRAITIDIEVVGFWTPQYLQEKHHRLQQFVLNRQDARRHWLLVFDRPPPKNKEDIFDTLHLPSVIVSKTKMPDQWIRIALE